MSRDPKERPSAKQALQHEWLKDRHKADRASGAPLSQTVVQRIQVTSYHHVVHHSNLPLSTLPLLMGQFEFASVTHA